MGDKQSMVVPRGSLARAEIEEAYETVTPVAEEARAALERIRVTLAIEGFDPPCVDDSTPGEDDWYFRLVRLAYPGGMKLEDVAAFLRANPKGRPKECAAKRKSMMRRKGNSAGNGGGGPLSRERIRQIETSALSKLRQKNEGVLRDVLDAHLDRTAKASDPMQYATCSSEWPSADEARKARDPAVERLYPDQGKARASWAVRLAPRSGGQGGQANGGGQCG